jgi:hypothetical protein
MSETPEPTKVEKEKKKSAFKRAFTPAEILAKKYETIQWSEKWNEGFGNPETTGIISICGHSGNGKSSFTMQMIKELSTCLGKGHMNAYEENAKLTMQNLLINNHMQSANGKITIIKETFDATYQRLCSSKSARFVVLDSVQAMRLTYKQYELLKELSERKLIIFILRADGKRPKGNLGLDIWYDSDLKIWVEGYVATSNGRHNPGGRFVIWREKAIEYHGTQTIEKI